MTNDLESDLRRRHERLERWTEHWTQQWLCGPSRPHYRIFVAAWAVACVARLTLLEPQHGVWWAASTLLLLGAAGLLKYGGRAFWLICWIGLAWPYFFLRDWMTQSTLMLAVASLGVLTIHARASTKTLLRAAHWLVAATYLIAAFHKLNTGFLAPELSCATYGWNKLQIAIQALPLGNAIQLPTAALNALPLLVLATETAIGLLLLARHRTAVLLGILLALAFHIPLTLVLAPAFVFVMALGFTAALSSADAHRVHAALGTTTLRRRSIALILSSTLLSGLTWGADHLVFGTKLGLILIAFFGAILLITLPPHPLATERDERRGGRREVTPLAYIALFAFLLNAATPYLGTQTQHTGAMLSNLRIDEGCWNHVLVPESARRIDPYLRIDSARMGPIPGAFTEREAVLTRTLWPPSSLRLIRKNWCRPHTRPIAVQGTYLGQAFALDDLCDPATELPLGVNLWGGAERFPGYLTLQKNLMRACPTVCVH